VFDRYFRCSKCLNSLTPEARDYLYHDLDAGYDLEVRGLSIKV
jgi:hypothetical protein